MALSILGTHDRWIDPLMTDVFGVPLVYGSDVIDDLKFRPAAHWLFPESNPGLKLAFRLQRF